MNEERAAREGRPFWFVNESRINVHAHECGGVSVVDGAKVRIKCEVAPCIFA